MPIQTEHPVYTKYKARWQRARHANDGEDAVKDAGETYLPKLEDQTSRDYDAYKQRAVYFNATGRTVDGFVGMINRKPAMVELPAQIEDMEEAATKDGSSLEELTKDATENMLISGRLGLLVDRPPQENEPAYLVCYNAEECINWREDDDDELLMVVLQEGYFEQASNDDPYKLIAKVRYRELVMAEILDEGGEPTGTTGYVQRIWEQDTNPQSNSAAGEYRIIEQIVPLKDGQPLDHIPFFFVNPKGVGNEVYNPPILDIANVNLAHYRNSADIEHGRHLTALPTPWVSGVDASDTGGDLPLGSGKAWRLPENAQTGFLEFQGTGLSSIQEGMEEKERKMAALGARMIEAPRTGVEAAETARIHQAGTSATVGDVAGSIGQGLEAALKEAAEWEGADPDAVTVELNKDFVDAKLTPQEITALVDAYLKGAITQETLLHNLKSGELLPEDRSIDEEMELLAQNNPQAAADGAAGQAAATEGPETIGVERDPDGNVVRLVRGR
jgi:hypothetical protein